MSRPLRAALVALTCLAVALPLSLAASPGRATAATPRAAGKAAHADPGPSWTRDEARAVLAQARAQLRAGTTRPHARGRLPRDGRSDLTLTLRDLSFARSALGPADRRTADALLARPTDPATPANPDGGDNLGGGIRAVTYGTYPSDSWCPTGGVACIHWVTGGYEAIDTTDRTGVSGVPDYVETVYATIARVHAYETGTLGFRKPLPDGGTAADPSNPDGTVDVYLANLQPRGLYGYCAPDGADERARKQPGYCVLDSDYRGFGIPPVNALRVTAAHEYFHAIQFAYDAGEDPWFMEGTATWAEDEVYDSINDNVQFLAYSPLLYPRTPVDYSLGLHVYGSFLFFKYASERLGPAVVRQFWEQADASRGRYSLPAIRYALALRRVPWAGFFALFGSWNTLPTGSYSERALYPTPVYTLSKVLSARSSSTGQRTVSLPHLASSAIRVSPASTLSTRKRLLVQVRAPYLSHGSTAIVQVRYRNGRATHTPVRLNRYGDANVLVGFNRTVVSSVVVVVSNSSTAMRSCGSVTDGSGQPVYSCAGRGVYDSRQSFTVRASLR